MGKGSEYTIKHVKAVNCEVKQQKAFFTHQNVISLNCDNSDDNMVSGSFVHC